MKRIPSFNIDHTKLKKGFYVSRYDNIGLHTITTFDLRFKTPYKETPLTNRAAHTIEHLCATWLRNSRLKDKVIYFGPMGCLTGFYLVIKGNVKPMDLKNHLLEMFRWVASYEGEIPGASMMECGNYLLHDLAEAKQEANKYLNDVVLNLSKENCKYPI